MVQIFLYTLRSGARVWINNLESHLKQEWHILKANFIACVEVKKSTQDLLEALQQLKQQTLQDYEQYEEAFFLRLLRLDSAQEEEEKLPEFIIKHYFINGLVTPLRNKVDCDKHDTFAEIVQVA